MWQARDDRVQGLGEEIEARASRQDFGPVQLREVRQQAVSRFVGKAGDNVDLPERRIRAALATKQCRARQLGMPIRIEQPVGVGLDG